MSTFSMLFVALFGSLLLSAFIYGPVWAYYLYELVYFLNPGDRWWGNDIPRISYSFIVSLTMLVLTAFHWKKHQNSMKEAPQLKWFWGLVFTYLLVTLFAVNDDMHQRFLGYLIRTWVIFLIAFYILDSYSKVETALLFFILGSAYIGYEAWTVGRNWAGRVEGIGTVDSPEANTVAASIVPAIAFSIYFVWHGSLRIKLLVTLCGAFIANGLVLINSRGAFLGVVAAGGYYVLYMMFAKYKLPKQKLFVTFIIVSGLAGAIHVVDDTFVQRMMTLETQSSIDSEGSGGRRMNFWLATFDMIEDHPLGTGIYGYETLSRRYLPTEFLSEEYGASARAVHSLWFQGLAEVSWLGMAFFILLLLSVFINMRKAKKALIRVKLYKEYYFLIALEAGCAGFLVSSSFINMFRSNVLYWLLAFTITATVVLNRRAKQHAQEKIAT